MDYIELIRNLINNNKPEETKTILLNNFNDGKFVEMFKFFLKEEDLINVLSLFNSILEITEYDLKKEELDELLKIDSVNDYISGLVNSEVDTEKTVEDDNDIINNKLVSIIEDRYIKLESNKDIESLINSVELDTSTDTGDLTKMYLKEISKIDLLEPEQERMAFISYMEETDPVKKEEIKNFIINSNLRLVVSFAKKKKRDNSLSLLDLIQEGNIGLIKAIDKYDVTKGFKFSTYASWWIKQSMDRGMADSGNTIRIPVHMVDRINKFKKAERYLSDKYEIDNPSIEMFVDYLGWDKDVVIEVKRARDNQSLTSLDESVGEEEDSSLIDFIADENNNVDDNLNELFYKREINKLLKKHKEKNNSKKMYIYKKSTIDEMVKDRNYQSLFIYILIDDKEIILSSNEYRKYFLNGVEGIKEFVKEYNLYDIDFKNINIFANNITKSEREEMIIRYRYGCYDENTRRFLKGRNYNNRLFDYIDNEPLILEKVGAIFDVVRERIRQIEFKVIKELSIESSKINDSKNKSIYLDEYVSIYDIANISKDYDRLILEISNPDYIKVYSNYEIKGLIPGDVTIKIFTSDHHYLKRLDLTILTYSRVLKRKYTRKKDIDKEEE